MIREFFSILALWLVLTPFAGADGVASKTFLWKVSSARGTAYLLGSVHAARDDIYPLPRQMEASFAAAQVLALEVNPEGPGMATLQPMMQREGIYPAGESLRSHLSPENFELVRKDWRDTDFQLIN